MSVHEDCPRCHGLGVITVKTKGAMRFERRTCPQCKGTGSAHVSVFKREVE